MNKLPKQLLLELSKDIPSETETLQLQDDATIKTNKQETSSNYYNKDLLELSKDVPKMEEHSSLRIPFHNNLKKNEEETETIKLQNDDTRTKTNQEESSKIYTMLDIFTKELRVHTIILALVWGLMYMVYYVFSYGVKAMYGDFYINLLVMFASETLFSVFPLFTMKMFGRKTSAITFLCICGVCLFIAIAMELWVDGEVKRMTVMAVSLLGKLSNNGVVSAIITLTTELYPTVVRSNGLSFASFVSRIFSMVSPFLIPDSGENVVLSYSIMGAACFLCCILVFKLPETKNASLGQTLEKGTIDRVAVDEQSVYV